MIGVHKTFFLCKNWVIHSTLIVLQQRSTSTADPQQNPV